MKGDKIICRGLVFECGIGFHSVEKKIKQKISVDFEATVSPLKPAEADKIKAIRLDYFKANQQIGELFSKKHFKLIETAAEEVADLILKNFDVKGVLVTVTKYPLDMSNTASVSYQCLRK